MSEQNGVIPIENQAIDLPIDALPEPRCHATTRSGQPCRNRPLEGERYCRVHAALEGSASAVPSAAVELVGSTDDDAPAREAAWEPPDGGAAAEIAGAAPAGQIADLAAAVEELEVEIRNHETAQPETRDLAAGALRLIRENLLRMPAEAAQRVSTLIRENLSSDYLDPDFWRGISMVLRYQIDEFVGMTRRRMRGEVVTDEYGMDSELVELVRPFSTFMYRTWWRVAVTGLEHVPDEGRALLIANHGGVLPWDAVMIATAVLENHPQPRVIRTLFPGALKTVPGVASGLAAFGQVPDLLENAKRLLEEDQLVCAFPEGLGGLGKLFKNRYQIQRFRRGGTTGAALATGAPIVPVAVVGAEETYPMLANVAPLAEMLRLPFFPITPLFPWLGPLGLVPLPSKWSIAFGEPIATAEHGPDAADDPRVVAQLAEQVRERIQALLDQQLAARTSVFR